MFKVRQPTRCKLPGKIAPMTGIRPTLQVQGRSRDGIQICIKSSYERSTNIDRTGCGHPMIVADMHVMHGDDVED